MKSLQFEFKGNKYTLEYTRDSVRQLEKSGFSLQGFKDAPFSNLLILFKGAFISQHKFIKDNVVEEMWEALTNKEALIEKLMEMYGDTAESFLDEPDDEGKVNWEASW